MARFPNSLRLFKSSCAIPAYHLRILQGLPTYGLLAVFFEAVTKLKTVRFEPQDIALGFGVECNLQQKLRVS